MNFGDIADPQASSVIHLHRRSKNAGSTIRLLTIDGVDHFSCLRLSIIDGVMNCVSPEATSCEERTLLRLWKSGAFGGLFLEQGEWGSLTKITYWQGQ
jgi:hypothetical protein